MEYFIELLTSLTGYTIIQANQSRKIPSYPFITMQVTSRDRQGLDIMESVISEDKLTITEKLSKNIKETIQVDFFNSTISNTRDLANNFIDCIDFKFKREILSVNYGIIDIGNIIDNTSLDVTKAINRLTCDLTINYTEIIERNVENLQGVQYSVDNTEKYIGR